LRKLPRTNAIIFGVNPVLCRLGDLADVPLVPGLLEKVHRESDPAFMKVRISLTISGQD
jgi:hypothetical protein